MTVAPEPRRPCPRCLELAHAYAAAAHEEDPAAALAFLVTAIVHVADTHGATLNGGATCEQCRRYKSALCGDATGLVLPGWRGDAASHFATHVERQCGYSRLAQSEQDQVTSPQ
ncbi:hypothetical protein ABZT26_25945 [Streptomyces sp. NPDC005395]|uniref:hypothetical protein n=1 Tax=Streptomyces sp. NPDC005395 TaxID=3157042 RepID=UPI0033BC5E0F